MNPCGDWFVRRSDARMREWLSRVYSRRSARSGEGSLDKRSSVVAWQPSFLTRSSRVADIFLRRQDEGRGILDLFTIAFRPGSSPWECCFALAHLIIRLSAARSDANCRPGALESIDSLERHTPVPEELNRKTIHLLQRPHAS